MMATPAGLPTLSPMHESETHAMYGSRVLMFLLATSITATLPDEALELAMKASTIAHANPALSDVARDRIVEVRRLITAVLHMRRQALPAVPPAAKHDDRPDVGPMARVQDAPVPMPPAPAMAVPPRQALSGQPAVPVGRTPAAVPVPVPVLPPVSDFAF